ncbi:hypothetical protein TrVE_jg3263 [Triparma verrucosa]|uniref:AB hydrolase-1 domain-containing protein n=1 Tax=Triparma verrucosa TaxID=1606542 RepID=A0A9W7BJ71_9STRA|nr:hypothetical protein TrVE_jg3263 [Triparma verrucosa]
MERSLLIGVILIIVCLVSPVSTYTPSAISANPSATFRSSRLTINKVRHHIRSTPEPPSDNENNLAPVVILLHGFTGSTESFTSIAPLLQKAGVRCVAIDRVGFGRTERPKPLTLPLPEIPGRFAIANRIDPPQKKKSDDDKPSGLMGLVPTIPSVLSTTLRRPATISPRFPWRFSKYSADPYSSDFSVSTVIEVVKSLNLQGRDLYVAGHSAGGPIALRAFNEVDEAVEFKGVMLIAPAVLELEEDSDAYNQTEEDGASLPLSLRFLAFRTLLTLPDAFSIKVARRLVERDFREAVLAQTHKSISEATVEEMVDKYSSPVREFPDEWDTALLNVYRADFNAKDLVKGRKLLESAKERRKKIMVVTGDEDNVVPVRASTRVASLLGVELDVIEKCGHLPMDERPEELARMMIDFINDK